MQEHSTSWLWPRGLKSSLFPSPPPIPGASQLRNVSPLHQHLHIVPYDIPHQHQEGNKTHRCRNHPAILVSFYHMTKRTALTKHSHHTRSRSDQTAESSAQSTPSKRSAAGR